MIILAVIATFAAIFWSLIVLFANSMRSSPGKFVGAGTIWAAWIGVVVLWLAWWFG